MDISELFKKAISGSQYSGRFEYNKLLSYENEKKYNAIATGSDEEKSIILLFINGEIEGAAQIDEYGMLYGDSVIYNLDKTGFFELFVTDKRIADSLVSRMRVFNKKYLKPESVSPELQEIRNFSTKPSKVSVIVKKNDVPVQGLKIIMKKDNNLPLHDYTSSDGSAGFFLQGGDYLCSITEKDKTEHEIHLKLDGKETIFTINI
ncbi:hypothetical protein J2128_000758 [Methanomicrobium sp. W14]|uniref:hypothetical protein n=1 Tax=Methanomicrobium sp. W14 TaxID=2817839 RepID=UPI001AE924B8|nr:hypothetical protein [Methanomicrobium sp. W14]MBP2132837.1 hypothetical protein [Methanomicrobium sp. W14]